MEYSQSEALMFDNGRLKQATYDTAQGFGLRAVKDDAVGYAHSSDVFFGLRADGELADERGEVGERARGLIADVKAKIERDLIVPRARGMEALADVAEHLGEEALDRHVHVRGTGPKELTGLLREELDWVVMKALEKDRARRYESPNGFAADVPAVFERGRGTSAPAGRGIPGGEVRCGGIGDC